MSEQVPAPRLSSGLTSTSLDRAPGPASNCVRGKAGYVPFWPGGMDDVLKESIAVVDLEETSQGLLTVPPGFSRGLRFPGEEDEEDIVPAVTSRRRTDGELVRAEPLSCLVSLSRLLTCLHKDSNAEGDTTPDEVTPLTQYEGFDLDNLLPTTVSI